MRLVVARPEVAGCRRLSDLIMICHMVKECDNSFVLKSVNRTQETRDSLFQRMYSIPELIQLTGMTRKQVSYWAHLGLVTPAIRDANAKNGQPSTFYSISEVIKALIVCELRRFGFSPRQVEQLALNFQQFEMELSEEQVYLLTDGHSVYYARTEMEVVDILRSHRQMFMLIPIREQLAKLKRTSQETVEYCRLS